MHENHHASLLSIMLFCVFAVPSTLRAELPVISEVFLSEVRTTQSGEPVAVRIADPFARPDQERALLRFLNEPYTSGWDNRTTVADIQRAVGEHVALQIDHRSLDEMGLSADECLFPESGSGTSKTPATNTPSEDPFADQSSNIRPGNQRTRDRDDHLTRSSSEQRWWDRKRSMQPVERMTNAAKLFHGLSNVDLVIATWSGQWLITTEDAAEANLSTRLYDVTPIANMRYRSQPQRYRGGMSGHDGSFGYPTDPSDDVLLDVIQSTVDTDTWESLGGPSTCREVVINSRTWLVISAPVITHWKVQALLNQLNGS